MSKVVTLTLLITLTGCATPEENYWGRVAEQIKEWGE